MALSSAVRKNRAFIAVGVTAILSLWSAEAAAQSFPAQGTPGAGLGGDLVGRLGGNREERKVDADLSLSATYDSNVARGNEAVATVRDVRKDDYLYQPSARVDLNLPAGGQVFFLRGGAGYDFYQYNKVLQRERLDVLAGLTTSVGPCQGTLEGGYNRHQSDLADLVATVTKNIVEQTTVGVQASCATGSSLSEFVGYQHVKSTNSASVGVVDADVDAVNIGANYGNRTIGTIGVSASYSNADYGNTATLVPVSPALPITTGFETYSAQVTFSRPIGNRFRGMAELGVSKAKPKGTLSAVKQDFTGITGMGSLSYEASNRLNFNMKYHRRVTPTIQDGTNFAILQNIGLDAHYELSSRLGATLGASWSERSFKDQLILVPGLITDDKVQSIYGALRMQIGRHGSLSLDARQDIRNTNITLFNYTAYRVGLTATQSF